jgi:cytochrome c-type biogenesis protein CcmF
VLLGTLFPLVAELGSGARLSVGPPFFNRVAVPIALAILLVMAVGPVLRWDGEDRPALARRMAPAAVAGGLVVGLLGIAGVRGVSAVLAFGLAAAVATTVVVEWVEVLRAARGAGVLRAFARRQRRQGALVAHLGMAVLAVGVAASATSTASTEHRLAPGDEVVAHGVRMSLTDLTRERTPRAMATAAHLTIGDVAVTSRLSFYPSHGMTVSNPAIRSSWTRDLYVTLLEVDEQAASATVRLAVNPLVGWIWGGGALMVVGAALAGWPARGRLRAGSPQRETAVPA